MTNNIIELFIEDLGTVTGGVGDFPSSAPSKEEGGHTLSVGEGGGGSSSDFIKEAGGGGTTDCFPRPGNLK